MPSTNNTSSPPSDFITTETELAAYLTVTGHKLLGTLLQGRYVAFRFPAAAADDVTQFFEGASCPARDLLVALRSLRVLVQQVKEHHQPQQPQPQHPPENHNQNRKEPSLHDQPRFQRYSR